MSDLKLPKLLEIGYPRFNESAAREPRAEIKKVSERFFDNIRNVKSVPEGFLSLVGIAIRYEGAAVEAAVETKGRKVLSDTELDAPEFKKELDRLLHQKVDEFEKKLNADADFAFREDKRILKNIQFVLDLYGQDDPENPHIRHLRSMFKAMITGTWTAFEVMAADLWEVALNIHPKVLASLCADKGEMEKVIKLEVLERNNYNLSGMMGTIHRQSKRFNFQILEGIRSAYVGAFRRDNQDVLNAILDKSIDALALMRNLIVHKGGIVDDLFKKDGREIPLLKKWVDMDEGTPIALDGADVASLLTPSIAAMIGLLNAVDGWLFIHDDNRTGHE